MIAKVYSAGLYGIDAYVIDVEVDIRLAQLPTWCTVGLPESAVKEGKDRVISAIKNSGYDFIFRRVTINLAPANTKKEGTAFDLPIAIALMVASDVIRTDFLHDTVFVGELSLTGNLRTVNGVLPMAILAREKGFKRLILPRDQAMEAAMVSGIEVYGFDSLSEVVEFISGHTKAEPIEAPPFSELMKEKELYDKDFSEIYGQFQAKRAIEIAAAGAHNILLSGPPGSGKTMLASRIPSILPALTFEESLETSKVYSVTGLTKNKHQLLTKRPFRDPHHSISNAGLIGGGSYPKPGEVSLAHNGVLFLDEVNEFQKHVLELLRQPLESHTVTVARAAMTLSYPARFILVASCNPCPCGYLGHPKVSCQCAPGSVQHYKTKLSGPLLDRIDLQIQVPPVPYEDMRKSKQTMESSKTMAERVMRVRQIQAERFKGTNISLNSQMTIRLIESHCALDESGEKILKSSMEKFHLSARAISRILKVSRTIADMDGTASIKMEHVLEAVQYRGAEVFSLSL